MYPQTGCALLAVREVTPQPEADMSIGGHRAESGPGMPEDDVVWSRMVAWSIIKLLLCRNPPCEVRWCTETSNVWNLVPCKQGLHISFIVLVFP